jgi:hypothetical protein
LPLARRFLPLALPLVVLLGCAKDDNKPEPGGKPRPGSTAPQLEVTADAAGKAAPTQLSEACSGSVAVLHFDTADCPLAGRQSKELAAAKAKDASGAAWKAVAVVVGERPWQGITEDEESVFHADAAKARDAWGADSFPMIVVVDAKGVVRHVGGFTRSGELLDAVRAAGLAEKRPGAP